MTNQMKKECFYFNPTQIDPGFSYRCQVKGHCPAVDMTQEEKNTFWGKLSY